MAVGAFEPPPSPGKPIVLARATSHDGAKQFKRSTFSASSLETYCLRFRPVGAQGFPSFEAAALPFCSARVLKAKVRAQCRGLIGVPDDRLRLLYRGVELPDDGPVGKHLPEASGECIVDLQFMVLGREASHHEAVEPVATDCGLSVCEGVPCPEALRVAVQCCEEALRKGVEPMMARGGTGGVYMLRDAEGQRTLGVFKPKDEEAGAPQNPRGYGGRENSRGERPGVPSAQRATREVAAYLLDHEGFAGVPMTTLVHARHTGFVPLRVGGAEEVVWKVGGFQAFVETEETADNFGAHVYPVADVHRIGILDVRIASFDRNHGNVLVRVGRDAGTGARTLRLVPIDHGCSLPDRLAICHGDVVWMAWPQTKQPFGEEELRYIAALDASADAALLAQQVGLERCGLRLLEVTTRWLQAAAARGLTLFEVGKAMYREDASPATPSAVEVIVEACFDTARASTVIRRKGGLYPTVTYDPVASQLRGPPPCDGIFHRYDCRGTLVEWSKPFEEAFFRHLAPELDRLARERAPAQALSRRSVAASGSSCPAGLSANEASVSDASEEKLPPRSSGAYVPPHLRRQSQ
mmetsp:Transcript_85980/g.277726  ORF Transcript_85980/g.277726 Transcript_85980/m.277726 type:complete len:581 (+) Transcript_85980:84-1826(+)